LVFVQQISKEACMDAHGRGQDLRELGKFSGAREQFLKCAQSACPAMIQSDCARFGDELQHVVPTVTFAARDADGKDVPDTTVFVDDVQVTTRLDGRAFELDPGSRTIRFVHDGKTVEQKVVVSQGEKGRMIVVTLAEPQASGATGGPSAPPGPGESPHADGTPGSSRSGFPLMVAGIGGAALVAGVALIIAGTGKIPGKCDYFSKECTAAPKDPVFDDAKSGAGMINVGIGLSVAGTVVATTGLIWYFAQSTHPSPTTGVAPWVDRRSGGLSFRRQF
jgi:hypothetical protein